MDKTTTTNKLTFEIDYTNGDGESASRTISFDTYLASANRRTNAIEFANRLRNGIYKYAIQPTTWRDDDDAESAWEVSGVAAKVTTTTTTTIDPDNWDPEN